MEVPITVENGCCRPKMDSNMVTPVKEYMASEDWRSLFNMESHPHRQKEDFKLLAFHVSKLNTKKEVDTWNAILMLTAKCFPKLKEIELFMPEDLSQSNSEASQHKHITFANLKEFLNTQNGVKFSWTSTPWIILDDIEYELWDTADG